MEVRLFAAGRMATTHPFFLCGLRPCFFKTAAARFAVFPSIADR